MILSPLASLDAGAITPRGTPMTLIVLTGAGISADSGVPTFRDADGIWAKFDWQRLATPEAFAANPSEVHDFYNLRRRMLPAVSPNPAHEALARLDQALLDRGEDFLLVTQNVDNLHRRAGSKRMLQMHGRLDQVRCVLCGDVADWGDDCFLATPCQTCEKPGGLRPNIVWFGEMPMGMELIEEAMETVRHFVAIGTSGSVYPAAGLVAAAAARGAKTTEFNLKPSDNAAEFQTAHYGQASQTVPEWVATAFDVKP